jgi:hypothetical protein
MTKVQTKLWSKEKPQKEKQYNGQRKMKKGKTM